MKKLDIEALILVVYGLVSLSGVWLAIRFDSLVSGETPRVSAGVSS